MSPYDVNEVDQPKRSFINWSPEFNAGTAALILSMIGSVYLFGGEISAIKGEQANQKKDSLAEAQRSKETIADMKASVAALDTKIQAVNDKLGTMAVTMAEIRATQQQRVSK